MANRIQQHWSTVCEVAREPSLLPGHLRRGLLSMWIAKGAGYYGLGWLIAYIYLEVRLLTGEVSEATGVLEFIRGQLLEYVLRLGIMSFVNVWLAFLWPTALLEWFGAWGLVWLVLGYAAFEYGLRPLVERQFPELAVAREQREARRAEKRSGKKKRKGKDTA